MKHFSFFAVCLFAMLHSNTAAHAQNVLSKGTISFGLATPEVDALRVRNFLLAHDGNPLTPQNTTGSPSLVGTFNPGAKWIGIGAPVTPGNLLYGERTQWNGQAFIKALRQRSISDSTKDAILEWGGNNVIPGNASQINSEMQFRYITNPNSPTGFTRILTMKTTGNAYFGLSPIPIISTIPKLGVNSNVIGSPAIGAIATNTPAGEFQGAATVNGFAQGVIGYIRPVNTGTTNYAVRGLIDGVTSGSNAVGVFGQILGTINANNANYAVSGLVPANSGTNTFAGFFQGNVFTTGLYLSSDGELKKNVTAEKGAVKQLGQLNPVSYDFKTDTYKDFNLPNQKQHGLIAEEVQQFFPELVTTTRYFTKDEKENMTMSKDYLAVNYMGFIPLLIKGMQEQQSQLQQQQTEIETLKAALASSSTVQSEKPVVTKDARFKSSQFVLEQNTPNPFSSTTTIRYALPDGIRNATLAVFDLNGRMLLQYNNLNGSAQLTINGNTLQAGMYIYTLLAEGQEVASKRMILTK
jgi:hypothetical protein